MCVSMPCVENTNILLLKFKLITIYRYLDLMISLIFLESNNYYIFPVNVYYLSLYSIIIFDFFSVCEIIQKELPYIFYKAPYHVNFRNN